MKNKRNVKILFLKSLFIYYVYNILPPCMPTCQKRAPDLITDDCESPCGSLELNSVSLEELPLPLNH